MFCQKCGQPTAQQSVDGRLRPVCTACGAVTYQDPKLAVAVVIERDGSVLLGKRAAWTRSPGLWSFPAGFVDRGERVELAAIREVQEEVGLTVSLGDVLGVYSADGDATVLLAFPARYVSGDPVAGDDLLEVDWFDQDRLPDLAFAHDLDILARWRSWRALFPDQESTTARGQRSVTTPLPSTPIDPTGRCRRS